MVRALVALLLIANLGFFAWTQGWLDGVVGVRSIGDREPDRLQRQVRPEAVRVLTPQAASGAATAAASAAEARLACLELGPVAPEAATTLLAELATAMPSVAFVNQKSEKPASYLVYMGPYPNAELIQRKREELGRAKVSFEEVTAPAELKNGLALGHYDDRAAADAALAQFAKRNVRSARVVQQAPAGTLHRLRAERVDTETAARLFAFKFRSLEIAKGFSECAAR